MNKKRISQFEFLDQLSESPTAKVYKWWADQHALPERPDRRREGD